jgi:ATP-binding cassette subfamily C (CFTR/MRP) protein 5
LTGLLKGKTILFITNQLQYLPFADNIFVLDEGKLVANGNFKDLLATNDFFKNMMTKFGDIDENRVKSEETVEEKKATKAAKPEPKKTSATKPTGNLTKLEEKSTGLVSSKVYWYYIKAGGPLMFLIILGCFAMSVTGNIGSCKDFVLP